MIYLSALMTAFRKHLAFTPLFKGKYPFVILTAFPSSREDATNYTATAGTLILQFIMDIDFIRVLWEE